MSISFETLSAPLPAPARWTFGGRPYGLEPLILPTAAVPGEDLQRLGLETADGTGPEALAPTLLTGAAPTVPGSRVPDGDPRIPWFRWITGHQISFAVWRLLAQEIRTVARTEGHRRAVAVDAVIAYVRGYCAMLLYTASCPREVYEALIRPSMFLAHPGFSGTWAADFAAVRPVFRSRQLSWLGRGPGADEVRRTVAVSHLVHAGVAARLVPEGGSLLQEAPVGARRPALAEVLYDSYFLTTRMAYAEAQVVPQAARSPGGRHRGPLRIRPRPRWHR